MPHPAQTTLSPLLPNHTYLLPPSLPLPCFCLVTERHLGMLPRLELASCTVPRNLRQSGRAARLPGYAWQTDVISENPGKGKGPASNHLFVLSFSKKKKKKSFFLMKLGGWGRLITLPTWLMVPRRGCGPPSRSSGDAYVFQMGCPLGRTCPAGTRVTWGLSHSITHLTAPWRLQKEGSAKGWEEKLLYPSRTSTGVGLCGAPVLGLSKLAASSLPGAEMFTLSI